MFTSRGQGPLTAALGGLTIILLGMFATVMSVYLLINPALLPSIWNLPLAARFVPTVFMGIVALLFPLLSLGLALMVMFVGAPLLEFARPLFPISPFWILLGMTLAALVIRNMGRNKALPWGIMLAMLSIIALVAIYELESFSLKTHGLLFPLIAGFMLVTALGMLRIAKQITFVVGALIVAFLALELQLLPFLIPSWGTWRGVLREIGPSGSTLRQVTSLDWLLTTVALLCLGIAIQTTGKGKFLLLSLFIVFATSSILTFTRGSFVGLGAGVLGLLVVGSRGQGRSLVWALAAALLLFLIARYSNAWTYNVELRGLDVELGMLQAGEPGRLTILVEGIKAMPSHLFVGQGAIGPVAHSSSIDIWNNYGGVTAVLLWGFVLILFRRSFVMAKAATRAPTDPRVKAMAVGLYCSFAGAVAISLVDTSFFNLTFAMVFWLLRGLEIAIWRSGLVTLPQPTSGHRARPAAAAPGGPISPKGP